MINNIYPKGLFLVSRGCVSTYMNTQTPQHLIYTGAEVK